MEIEQFWLDNYKVLYKNNNYVKFVPMPTMTKIQQLNAITRFSIYFFILLMVFEQKNDWLFIPIFLIILTVILSKVHHIHLNKLKKNTNDSEYNVQNNDNKNKLIQYQDKEDILDENKNIEQLDEYDKSILYEKERECVEPTKDNPFMNFLLSDYMDDPKRPKACAVDDNSEQITNNFNYNLYRDVDDLFDKKNSQRQFYTMPVTTNPSKQKEFAEWLYKVPETCKTDQVNCLRYEDLRYKRI